jgi:hypothetical protein
MPSATRCAPSSLTRDLIDDAAIFPPGLTPLTEAVERHRALRRSPLARYLGPFLLRASWWQEFTALQTGDVDVVLICRPDEGAGDLESAIRGLTDRVEPQRLRRVELPWAGKTAARRIATLLDGLGTEATLAFEIDGTAPDVDLAAIGRVGLAGGRGVVGKFRTGGVRPEDSPPPGRLAGVIAAAARRRVPVKFTAGLHHVVTGPHGPGDSVQFGVLNVMCAVRQAVSLGGDASQAADAIDALCATLMRTDATSLAAEAMSLDAGDADAIRGVFTSFGCCGVTEPLTELAALGVIPDRPEGQQR